MYMSLFFAPVVFVCFYRLLKEKNRLNAELSNCIFARHKNEAYYAEALFFLIVFFL